MLNPNQPGCPYPEKNLCGAAVAFKLAQGLLATLGWPGSKLRRVTESLLKMVAIATVADVVPLTGENRVIVKHGLDGWAKCAIRGCARCWKWPVSPMARVPSARQVAFQIAPRLNAAGRMDTAKTVIELFLSADPARARELAQQLHDQNAERRQVEAEIREICEQIAGGRTSTAALVYYGEDWHRGVLGISGQDNRRLGLSAGSRAVPVRAGRMLGATEGCASARPALRPRRTKPARMSS